MLTFIFLTLFINEAEKQETSKEEKSYITIKKKEK